MLPIKSTSIKPGLQPIRDYTMVLHQCNSWPNFVENFSDGRHAPMPTLVPYGKGYNYYGSVSREDWENAIVPQQIAKSFQSNDASFMSPVQSKEFMLTIR